MGQERKEKPEEGRPTCRHARTKVWFREKRSSNVQTQTFITPPGSSGSEASALCSNDTGVYQCSSSKWHDRPSDTELARCHQVDSTVEQSGSVEDDTRSCRNPKQFENLRKKCESRGSSSSRASSHQEKRIYLHLNLRNRESPQLLVCPKRNHCQHHSTSRSETVIQVDSEPLPRPSRPPSRFSEPALSMFSFARRSGHQNLPQISLHDSSQLQSLRQTYAGSGSRSSSDKLPSPTASLTPKRRAQIHNVERQLAHERAMSITPRGCDLDSHSDLAQLAHERAMSTTLRGSDLDPRFNHALRRHNFSSSACGACDPNPQSQISASVEEEMLVARHVYVDEALLPLPKWPHGQPLYAIPKSPPSLVKNEVMLEPDSVTLGRIATPRIISSKKDPMRVKGGSGTLPTDLSNWYVEPVESSAPPKTDGVVLSWEGLTVTSKVGKMLLDNLNGQIICGFTAIIGPSGSGKSTLLNTLACRMGQSASITGRILLNGRDYKIADLKKMSGYVMQDDLLNAHLTVEETLKYTTRLKLEPSLTEEEVYTRVDDIIKQMGLDHVRNTVIGSPEKRGISGGERKRVCVGMELLTHPQLLFLDEPTSGLDSVTALSLCEQLQKLAAAGNCTIICTIHQPQAKIFNLFHYLIILKAGQVIYQGKASEVLQFFEDSGFPCPEYTNPADHLLDVITPSMNKPRESLRNVDDALRSKFNPLPVNMSQGSEYLVLQTTRDRMPWHRQYMVILNRGFREQIRKKNVFITQMCQSVLMALLIGGVFFQIGDHQKSTVRRQPVLFFCVINQGVFGALTVINSFPGERALTLRERAAGMYYCSSYFMAKVTAEMVSQVISPVIFSCIVYWMVGFQRNGSKFMIFMVLMVLCQLAATSLALMVSAICRTTDLSVTVLPMALEVNRLFGGFFLSPKSLPKYFVWLDALSYVKYTYTAISLNELHGLKIRCTASEYVGGECPITSGEQTIRSLGLDYLNIGSCTTILLFYILITRVIAYLGIRYLKK